MVRTLQSGLRTAGAAAFTSLGTFFGPVRPCSIGASWLRWPYDVYSIQRWRKYNRSEPPPHALKQQTVRRMGRRFGARVLIESGTFHGAMISAVRRDFGRIVSIELDHELAAEARRRFSRSDNVDILQGDSGVSFPGLLATIEEPCVFWLDGHYSGPGTAKGLTETPIVAELGAILEHGIKGHVVLIDDARCFDGTLGYPHLADIGRIVEGYRAQYCVSVHHDIIRLLPRKKFRYGPPTLVQGATWR